MSFLAKGIGWRQLGLEPSARWFPFPQPTSGTHAPSPFRLQTDIGPLRLPGQHLPFTSGRRGLSRPGGASGRSDNYVVDSAGTGAWHVGERPDPRSVQVAAAHGVTLPGTARQVTSEDLDRFDLVVAMDRENLEALKRMATSDEQLARLHLLRTFDADADDDQVPDPYYGGPGGFEKVYRQVDAACRGLLESLEGTP